MCAITIFTCFGVKAQSNSQQDNSGVVHGKVVKMHGSVNSTDKNSIRYAYIDIKITSGKLKGQIITVQNSVSGKINDEGSNTQSFAQVGDDVMVNIDNYKKGDPKTAYIYEIVRYKYLYELGIVFALLLVVIGGMKGLKSLITLAITGFSIVRILIPLVIQGFNPMTVAIAICIFLIIVNLTIISGRNKKTLAAIIGTSGGVVIAGFIASFSNSILRISGLTDDEMQTIIYTVQNSNFNFSGLLFAEIIMGALGAVMDTSVSIASSIKEIKDAKPDMNIKELFKSGMNVGKDIMGSMSNTLILAYAGGAMYLMIMIASYSYTSSISTAINQDVIAAEVLKALAGSIGLILAIPITAFAAAFLSTIKEKPDYTKYESEKKVDLMYNKLKKLFSPNKKEL
ncbi:YibE/F family protein [Clostridium tyrobutyricum]|uniref:YibE/F family protein n=1 Tax=Clostridium tyrobutyricum TaxID=1519 RepID=UPI001C39591E|nr:YibE/F family protein [Clostridium tyrobutyricum]MBV4419379.1 YibE/F family protein [Clostridium tyrobutyricum]